MNFQKKQEKFYRAALIKQRLIQNAKIKDEKFYYTADELDSIDYFNGQGFYKHHQSLKVKPNIFDTRQSFLLKMHDKTMCANWLKTYNSFKNQKNVVGK